MKTCTYGETCRDVTATGGGHSLRHDLNKNKDLEGSERASQPYSHERRRSCMYGEMREARARLHFLNILFRRSDQRFERQLRNPLDRAGKRAGDVC